MSKEFKTRIFGQTLRNRRKNEISTACSVKTATAVGRARTTRHVFTNHKCVALEAALLFRGLIMGIICHLRTNEKSNVAQPGG